ncbi:MAG TPA: RDD family protein [Novosphingobium sp.]|nr:RDD family protein [Novosphingobium sp.]
MPVYGGFWIRFVAYIIDAVILFFAEAVIGAALGLTSGFAQTVSLFTGADIATETDLLASGISIVMGWLYFALMESSGSQATVGKLALGLVVTDTAGDRISFLRATGRHFAKFLSSLILLIGYIMIAFTDRKQGLHDMIASTLVTKKGTLQGVTSADVFR